MSVKAILSGAVMPTQHIPLDCGPQAGRNCGDRRLSTRRYGQVARKVNLGGGTGAVEGP